MTVAVLWVTGETPPRNVEFSYRGNLTTGKSHLWVTGESSSPGKPLNGLAGDYSVFQAKMPIAIKKILLKDFNGVVSLSDADSLSVKLSESTEVLVVVRISSTGLAVKQADDIEIISDAISLAETRSIDLQVE